MTSNHFLTATNPGQLASTYEIAPGIYLLGGLASGVTVYSQQVRAHNLASAIGQLKVQEGTQANEIAVIGAGIAGLTFTAGLLSCMSETKITLFEKRWDLCPLQQGSDTRWIHPRIYDWPRIGSRPPSAGLPVLNWQEGRASDVARTILNRFADYCDKYGDRLDVHLGLSHLSVSAANRVIEWMGRTGDRKGKYFRAGTASGDTKAFDIVVVASGFGMETELTESSTSYWRNDDLGQPSLIGQRKIYIVSGFGDGAIVDLCRLTIERFRQDRILEEIFDKDLEVVEGMLQAITGGKGGRLEINVKSVLDSCGDELGAILKAAINRLHNRLRKDVSAVLHARGRNSPTGSIEAIFGNSSSFFNRVLLYLLYRAGAFSVRFDELSKCMSDLSVSKERLVTRYGTAAIDHVSGHFSDVGIVAARLAEIKEKNEQVSDRLWPLGFFPYVSQGATYD
jgi:hypothetical protein